MATSKTILVVSPHLDDAVLSLGALMAAERRLHRRVVVLTVFTSVPEGDLPPAALEDRARFGGADPYPARLREDSVALRILDVESMRADLPELIFRWRPNGTPRCGSLEDIFGSVQGDDESIIAQTSSAIGAAIAEVRPDKVFVPLGVGNHVDHVIVRRAAELLDLSERISYYQDMPYVVRGEPVVEPPNSERIRWQASDADVALWLDAIAAYENQLEILFESSDWRQSFRDWLTSGAAHLFKTTG